MLYDNAKVSSNDLTSNYFLSLEDINKTTRAEGSLEKLKKLSSSAQIEVFKDELSNNFSILDKFRVVVISEMINLEMAETLDKYCRNKKIGFIYAVSLGLTGFAFNDFGDDFIVTDSNGEEPKTYFIRNISNACPGVVVIDNTIDRSNLELGSGDYVTFKEVSGMSELNDTPPRPIRVLSPCSFTIEDTSKFQEYNCNGTVEEVKVPRPAFFKPLKEAKNIIYQKEIIEEFLNEGIEDLSDNEGLKNSKSSDESKNKDNSNSSSSALGNRQLYYSPQIDESKPNQNEKIHLAMLALHEYFGIHNTLPHINNDKDIKECIEYAHKIHKNSKIAGHQWALNLNEVDEGIVFLMARFARIQLAPLTSFLGGIIGQEIVKFTGKFTPLEQWLWFDFSECIPSPFIKEIPQRNMIISSNSRYHEQIEMIGNKANDNLKDLNVLVIGCGALGNELLKMFALMGLATGKGTVTIADDDIIERSNLNPQFLFNSFDVGQRKSEKCREMLLKNNPEMNIECVLFKINQANDKHLSDEFWIKQDVIIMAVDDALSRLYVDRKCLLFKKILIDLEILRTKAHCQLVVPNFTSRYNDEYFVREKTVINRQFPTSIEHCIEWARDKFISLFSTEIKQLNLLLTANENNIKQIFDSFNLQTEYTIDTYLKIERFKKIIEIATFQNFTQIVSFSIEIFQQLFDFAIQDLLQKYPSDLLNDDGTKFWAGAKRQPLIVKYDLKDQKHFLFISTFAILMGKAVNMHTISEKFGSIKEIATKYKLKDYYIENKKIASLNKEGLPMAAFFNKSVNEFFNYILNYPNKPRLSPLIFDKEKDENQQINFIMAMANIRAQNYRIGECDFLKTKMCSGKFQPAVGTATASITAIASLQIISLCQNDIKTGKITNVDNLKNCFMNLGINTILMTSLFPQKIHKDKPNVKAVPPGWKTWDVIKVEKSMTLNEFINYFLCEYRVKVTKIIDCHSKCLNSFSGGDSEKKLEDLFFYGDKNKKCIHLEINGLIEDTNENVDMPFVEYNF